MSVRQPVAYERRETRTGWGMGPATRRLTGSQARSRLLELNATLFQRLKEAARERFGTPDYDPIVEVMAIGMDHTVDNETRLRAHAWVSKFIYTQRAQLDINVKDENGDAPPANPVEVADAIIGRLEEVARERRLEDDGHRPSEDRGATERERGLGVVPVQKTNGQGRGS